MNLPDDLTDEVLRRLAESTFGEPAKPAMTSPIMWNNTHIGWSGSCYDAARRLARELLTLRAAQENLVHVNAVRVVAEDAARLSAELAQARADLETAQATVNAVAKVMAQLRGDVLDTEAWGEDLAAPGNGGLLARMVAKMRADLDAAQDRLTLDQLRAELHRLATSTSPEADRCADALAALVEPLTPTTDQLVAWLEGRGWVVEAGGPDTWREMRRGRGHVSVPARDGARDRQRCVRYLLDDVARVEAVRRSRVVVDLWATTKDSTHA